MRRKYAIVAVVAIGGFFAILAWGYFGSIPYVSPLVHGQKYLAVVGPSMEPTIKVGATIAYEQVPFQELKLDDIIVFKRPGDNVLIVARIIGVLPEGLQTKGDNNLNPYPWNITATEYFGKVVRIDNPP
jgi:signal peptidase I